MRLVIYSINVGAGIPTESACPSGLVPAGLCEEYRDSGKQEGRSNPQVSSNERRKVSRTVKEVVGGVKFPSVACWAGRIYD